MLLFDHKTKILLILLTFLIIITADNNLQQRILQHFNAYDLDNNTYLERQQYIQVLKIEDQQFQTAPEDNSLDQYYYELTAILYEEYDQDQDDRISLEEWKIFSTDILDESSEQYQHFVENPTLIEPSDDL